jgi:multidrug efflux pump subunit AcrA (membrane-fusion protein)
MSKGFKVLGLITINILFIALITFKPVNASEKLLMQVTNTESQYKTIEAVKGDYTEKGGVMNAELVYLVNDILTIKEAEGTFVEYLVTDGQAVGKGDKLFSYRIPFDPITIEEKKLAFERTKSSYEGDLRRRESDIAENSKSLQSMDQTTIEAQSLRLRLTKMELGYDQFKYQGQANIKALEEAIDEMELNSEIKYVYAPYDGIVSTPYDGIVTTQFGSISTNDGLSEGMPIDSRMELVRINDTKSAVLVAPAAGANKLWYNQEVSVTMISSRQENKGISYPGRIVSIDSVLDNKSNTGMIFIKLDDESLYSTISSANVTADAVYLQDVFVLPLNTVNLNNEERYIYYLDETGDMHKQYITGRSNGVEMWVYDGLTEGQKIIVE